jgi:hypothetical protein
VTMREVVVDAVGRIAISGRVNLGKEAVKEV